MKFKVTSGGQQYLLDAPDQDSAIKAIQGLIANVKPSGGGAMGAIAGPAQAAPAAASMDMPSVGSEISDSVASRFQAGLLDVPGIPGDLGDMAAGAARWTADRIKANFAGETPEERAARHQQIDANGPKPLISLPSSGDVKNAVGFEAFQPRTEAGKTFDKYVGAGIELAPGLAAGGGVKKGVDLLKFALAPAAASEAAGEVTKGTALEPWARMGTSILTAVAAGGRGAKTGAVKAQTLDELKADSQALYAQAKQQGVMVKPAVLDKAIETITKNAAAFGIDRTIHPKAFAALKRLNEFRKVAPVAGKKTVASLEDIDMMRQILGDAASTMEKADSMRAMQMRDQLDDFVNNLKPADVFSSGNPKDAVNMLLKARSLWSKKAKGEVIAELMRRAELSAPNFSGSGAENAIRTEFRALAKNQKRMRQFNKEERAAIEGVAKGAPLGNLLRMLGKFAPTGIVSSALSSGVGFAAAGPAGAVALPAAGFAARHAATKITLDRARAVDELVRGGKAGKRAPRPPFTKKAILYGLAAQRAADEPK